MGKTRKTKTGDFATITNGELYYEDARQCSLGGDDASDVLDDKYLTAIRVVSLSSGWYEHVYLEGVGFHAEDIDMTMTLRKERRGQLDHWYAYRRVLGKLHKRYVGTSEKLTEKRLLEVAQAMPGIPRKRAS